MPIPLQYFAVCNLSPKQTSRLALICTWQVDVRRKKTVNAKQKGYINVKLRLKQYPLFLLTGRFIHISSTTDESLSKTVSFISPPEVSGSTPFSLLPFTLLHLHWDHKLLKIKPCFQSVRRASQCQGPSHPLSHLQRHLCGKICLPLSIPLSVICVYISQAPTHNPAYITSSHKATS